MSAVAPEAGYEIAASGLSRRYKDFLAVDAVDFGILPGECFGFLGPNGAGKTTVMKMISCVLRPSAGTLSVRGRDVLVDARAIKAELGVVPQDNNLDPDLTVFQNLEMYASFFGLDPDVAVDRARDLLDLMELGDRHHVPVDSLSGGMKRRLILARALLCDPKIVLLDEPTTGLDPPARQALWSRLRDLKRRGVTLILTTHYMEEATNLCDRLVMMDHGRILDLGTVPEVISRHVKAFALEITGDLEAGRALLPAETPHDLWGDRILVCCDDPGPLETLLPRFTGHLHLRATLRESTLEDVFLKLSGHGLS